MFRVVTQNMMFKPSLRINHHSNHRVFSWTKHGQTPNCPGTKVMFEAIGQRDFLDPGLAWRTDRVATPYTQERYISMYI